MRQQLIQTLLPAKKQKLQSILEWINDYCDQHQKEEVNKVLENYDFLITYPNQSMARVTHASDYLQHVPENRRQAQNNPKYSIQDEIRKRKEVINGLKTEIEELKYLR